MTLPPPYGQTPSAVDRPRRRWIVPVVIGSVAALLVFALAAFGIVVYVFQHVGALPPAHAPSQPLTEGDAGSPVAEQPLVCETTCFAVSTVEQAGTSYAGLEQLALPDNTRPLGFDPPAPVGELIESALADWEMYTGEPDACFFAPLNSPIGATTASDRDNDDTIYFLGTQEDTERGDAFDQAVRVFPDSASAERYMAQLSESISQCDAIEIGPVMNRYRAEITPAPAIDGDAATASIGWVRTGQPGPRWRAYVFDTQFGNLVVRSRLLTDGTLTEEQFRTFVEGYTSELAQLPRL